MKDNIVVSGLPLDMHDTLTMQYQGLRRDRSAAYRAERMHLVTSRMELADAIREFNDFVVKDERVEVVAMPFRDGVSIIQRRYSPHCLIWLGCASSTVRALVKELADAIRELNEFVVKHERVEVVAMPFRDGISIIQRRCSPIG